MMAYQDTVEATSTSSHGTNYSVCVSPNQEHIDKAMHLHQHIALCLTITPSKNTAVITMAFTINQSTRAKVELRNGHA